MSVKMIYQWDYIKHPILAYFTHEVKSLYMAAETGYFYPQTEVQWGTPTQFSTK